MPYIPTVFLGEKIIGEVSSDPRSLSACLLIRITHIVGCEIFQPIQQERITARAVILLDLIELVM